ncbi:MAG: LamG domain-containing protein [Candidatus Nanoarchaeia archaeon]|nr:LamG domain-containing protein [Candidatus Nanoarchaeia archaeon]MDD5357855.1 LamG domain-containing protein [Candidatus Nanoarchaeia archaeon]MDD5588774.1 LamG domain-containing protein [Candidatus Nanoarchaeia archaeon]
MVYKRYIKKGGKVYGPYSYSNHKENGKVVTEYLGKESSVKEKKLNSSSVIFIPILFLLIFAFMFFYFKPTIFSSITGNDILDGKISSSFEFGDTKYVELLVKTSDNVPSKADKKDWTSEMIKTERAYSGKQGYIVTAKPEGWHWGDLERDPKRYMIIKIPISEFNESWFEPEYNYSAPIYAPNDKEKIIGYEILTERKYKISVEDVLTNQELNDLKKIPYNDKEVRPAIEKTIEDISNFIIYNDWENRSEDLKLHGSSGVFSICDGINNATPCSYTSLAAWETAEDGDITATGPCIANITGIWTVNDTTPLAIAGWTTNTSSYVKIVTEPLARHGGKWNWTAYRLVTANSAGITFTTVNNAFVEGIQIYNTGYNGDNQGGILFRDSTGFMNISVSHNIVRGTPGSAQQYNDGIQAYTTIAGSKVSVWNNIIYNYQGGTDGGNCIANWDSTSTFYAYSNTVVNCSNGISNKGGAILAKNNLAEAGTCYLGTFTAESDYNACNGTDTTGTGTHNPTSINFVFADKANADFHLSASDTAVINNGTDLSADGNISFSDDIDYDLRTGTWDIGADEYIPIRRINQNGSVGTNPVHELLVSLSGCTAGDVIIVGVGRWAETIGTAPATDQFVGTNTGSISLAVNDTGQNSYSALLWTTVAADGNVIINWTLPGTETAYLVIGIAEYSGMNNTNPVNSTNHTSGVSTNGFTGEVNVGEGELLVAFIAGDLFAQTRPAGYDSIYNQPSANNNLPADMCDYLPSAGAYNTTWTNGNDDWTAVGAAFQSIAEIAADNPPVSILSAPPNNNISDLGIVTFQCNATDDFNLENVTLYIWNSSKGIIHTNSTNWNGTTNSTTFTYNFTFYNSTEWNCLVYDNASQGAFASANRSLIISSIDTIYPVFFSYYDNNATLIDTGTGLFNVSVNNTNGTVWLEINKVNTTAYNVTANVYNTTYTFATGGNYDYRWHAYGNGTNNNYNSSEWKSYTVNTTVLSDTTPPNINFSAPTPANASTQSANAIFVNVSVTDTSNVSAFIDFNRSLVAWYGFDSYNATGIFDNSSYENFGVVTGATYTSSGARGGAFSFNGVDGQNSILTSNNINLTSNFTISVWAKRYAGNILYQTAGSGILWTYNGGAFYDDVSNWQSGTALASGVWYHLVLVGNGTNIKMYQNGVLDATIIQNNIGYNSQPIYIGSHPWSNTFNGSLDELMIFNRIFSLEEINASYNAGVYKLYRNFTDLSNATYNFTAYAIDLAGNINKTGQREVTINTSYSAPTGDTTPPIINFSAPTPANASTQSANAIYVNVSVSDANNVSAFIDFNRSLAEWYNLNDRNSTAVFDNSSYEKFGIISGAVYTSSGARGGAFTFDGVDDYINVQNGSYYYDVCKNGCTVSAWVNAEPTSENDEMYVFSRYYWDNAVMTLSYDKFKQISFGIDDDLTIGGACTASSGVLLTFNAWQHLVGIYNGSDTLIYLNGLLLDTTSCGFSSLNEAAWRATGKFNIGNNGDGGNTVNGTIDEVMIFNRVLSSEEINASYNAGVYKLYRNFTDLSNGNHTFRAWAIDASGNINKTDLRLVNITTLEAPAGDTTPPDINFTYPTPANASTQSANAIYVNVSVSDANNVSAFIDFNRTLRLWFNFESWDGGATVVDNSTYGEDGTVTGGTIDGNGIRGHAINFSGGDSDGIDVTSIDVNPYRNFTVSFWVKKVYDSAASNLELIDKRDNPRTFHLYASTGDAVVFQVYNTSEEIQGDIGTGDNSLQDKNWHHVVAGYNGTTFIYLDGVFKQAGVITGEINTGSGNMQIGKNFINGAEFNGSIDEVMIFSRALTSEEISATYNAGVYNLYRNFTDLINGNYTYRAWAIDASGNINKTEPRTVNVSVAGDTTPPTISVIYPNDGTNSSNKLINVNYTAKDETAISACWYSNDTFTYNYSLADCGTNITGVTWAEGIHNVTIWVNDTAGNNNSASVRFTIDSIAPSISILYPANNSNHSNNLIDVNYTFSDLNAQSCWYSNDTFTYNYTLTDCGTNITDVTWAEGIHNVTVWGNDSFNNVNFSNVIFTIDTIKPGISILTPTSGTNSSNNLLDVNYTTSDINIQSCWYSNDTFTYNYTLTNCGTNITDVIWSEGIHNVTVWGNDSFNNENFSNVIFTIDSIKPGISILTPTTGTNSSNNLLDVNYSASDINIQSCWYSNDTFTYNYTLTDCGTNITDVTWADGIHNVTVWGNDSFNNVNFSNVIFTIDATAPNLTFFSQLPPDISTSNLFGEMLEINYTINDVTSSLNTSTIKLYYKSNSTTSDVNYYQNGTAYSGFFSKDYDSNYSEYFKFSADDNKIYIGTYNLDESYIETAPKTAYDLDLVAEYVKIQLINVTNQYPYNIFEIYAQNQTATSNTLRIYYCNSSYTTGNPVGNAGCTDFYNLGAASPFNHTHSENSKHHAIPLAINVTSGMVGNVYVTNTSYFLLRGRTGVNAWNVYYTTTPSRAAAMQTSTNNGVAWTEVSGTVDAHLHQYNGTASFWYYVCANDTLGNQNCSSVRQDLFNLSGLPPSAPNIYSPSQATYAGTININYTASLSLNSYPIVIYNISLANVSDESFISAIKTNNSANLSYAWDSTGIVEGQYIIRVEACDNQNQCSFGYSENFSIDNAKPGISILSPVEGTNTTNNQIDINYTASDINLQSCWYSNDTFTYNYSLANCGTNITDVTWAEGIHNVTVWANDTVNNQNWTSVRFTIDSIKPGISILTPTTGTNSSNNLLDVNYTFSDLNAQSCWYSNDTFTYNYTLTDCGTNITDVTWSDGIHNVTVWGNDSFNNENFSNVIFTIDTIPPYFTNLATQEIYSTQKLEYDINAKDDGIGLQSFALYNWTANFSIVATTGVLTNASPLASGNYYLNLSVNDTLGNTNYSILLINVTSDTIPPNVEIISPTATTYTTSAISFESRTNENSSCNYSLDAGITNLSLTPNSTQTGHTSSATLSNADYVSYFYCSDSAGNQNNSENINFTVNVAAVVPPVVEEKGGGGGGAITKAPAAQFTVNVESIERTLIINDMEFGQVWVNNNGNSRQTFNIKVEVLNSSIIPEEYSISIAPKSSDKFDFKINSPSVAGIYTGKIIISSGYQQKEVLVTLNIKTEKSLYDVTITIPKSMKTIEPSETLSSQIDLLQMGRKEKMDVTVTYIIKDFNGKIYLSETETIAVENQKTLEKDFNTEEFPEGDYVLGVELIYPDGIAVASSHFKVMGKIPSPIDFPTIIVACLTALILAGIYFVIRRYKKTIKLARKRKK